VVTFGQISGIISSVAMNLFNQESDFEVFNLTWIGRLETFKENIVRRTPLENVE